LSTPHSPPHFAHFEDGLKDDLKRLFEEDESSTSGISGHRKGYENYFLSIREDFLGQLTRDVPTGYKDDPTILSQMRERDPISHPGSLRNPHQFRPKRPYRLIYEEHCHDLND
jgi:hypothetical protein